MNISIILTLSLVVNVIIFSVVLGGILTEKLKQSLDSYLTYVFSQYVGFNNAHAEADMRQADREYNNTSALENDFASLKYSYDQLVDAFNTNAKEHVDYVTQIQNEAVRPSVVKAVWGTSAENPRTVYIEGRGEVVLWPSEISYIKDMQIKGWGQ